ncbi:Myc-type basic helix-loop-helix (bHLH) domain [Trinorchestia longiramus]|nr:Myc-type basic helix-loop-helix (bHLH) domain [Trinorchestia longiramus]
MSVGQNFARICRSMPRLDRRGVQNINTSSGRYYHSDNREMTDAALDCSTSKPTTALPDAKLGGSLKQSNTIKVLQINPKRILTGVRASLPNKLAKISEGGSGSIENECKIQVKSANELKNNSSTKSSVFQVEKSNSNSVNYEKVVKITQAKLLIGDKSTSSSVIKRPTGVNKHLDGFPKRLSSHGTIGIKKETGSPITSNPIKVIRAVSNAGKEVVSSIDPTFQGKLGSSEAEDKNNQFLNSLVQTNSPLNTSGLSKKAILKNDRPSSESASSRMMPASPTTSVITHYATFQQDTPLSGQSIPLHLSPSPSDSSSKTPVADFKGFKTCNVFMGAPSATEVSFSNISSFIHREASSTESNEANSSLAVSPQIVPVDYSSLTARSDTSDNRSSTNGQLETSVSSTTSTMTSTLTNGQLGIKIGDYEANVTIGDGNCELGSLSEVASVEMSGSNDDASAKLPSIESAFSRVAESFRYPKDPSPSYATLKPLAISTPQHYISYSDDGHRDRSEAVQPHLRSATSTMDHHNQSYAGSNGGSESSSMLYNFAGAEMGISGGLIVRNENELAYQVPPFPVHEGYYARFPMEINNQNYSSAYSPSTFTLSAAYSEPQPTQQAMSAFISKHGSSSMVTRRAAATSFQTSIPASISSSASTSTAQSVATSSAGSWGRKTSGKSGLGSRGGKGKSAKVQEKLSRDAEYKKSACDRERTRMRDMNYAYDQLRDKLPVFRPPGKKPPKMDSLSGRDRFPSKLETLRLAIRYIRHMANLLTVPMPHHGRCYPNCDHPPYNVSTMPPPLRYYASYSSSSPSLYGHPLAGSSSSLSPHVETLDYSTGHQYVPQGMASVMEYGRDPFWHGDVGAQPDYSF